MGAVAIGMEVRKGEEEGFMEVGEGSGVRVEVGKGIEVGLEVGRRRVGKSRNTCGCFACTAAVSSYVQVVQHPYVLF